MSRFKRGFISTLLTVSMLTGLLAFAPITAGAAAAGLSVQDPYMFVDIGTQTYYLYAVSPDAANPGVVAYRSNNLVTWSDPVVVYSVPGDSWNGQEAPSSPEVHLYNGKYYLFVTLQDSAFNNTRGANNAIVSISADPGNDGHYMRNFLRSVVVAVADAPDGPFIDLDKNAPISNDLTLMHRDGSLYVDPDGTPYLVYAHDWIQKVDGNFQAMKLNKDDLSKKAEDQFLLFRASLAAFYFDAEYEGSPGYKQANSDEEGTYKAFNPQLYDAPDGSLVMIWGTEREGKLVVSQAVSRTGNIKGPWDQKALLFRGDRDSAMSFAALDGTPMLLCAGPGGMLELYDAFYTGNGLRLAAHRGDLDGMDVDISDNLAPRLFLPGTRLVETNEDEVAVFFKPMAYDNIDGWVDVACSIPSGSVLAKGTYIVEASATDAAGNTATGSFKVIVQAPAPKPALGSDYTSRWTGAAADAYPNRLPAMAIHDPYIYYDPNTDHYIFHQGSGRNVWRSKDLINWSSALTSYTIVSNNLNFGTNGYANYASWRDYTFTATTPWNLSTGNWAAEMHPYNGKYYMLTTLHNSRAVPHIGAAGIDSERWRNNQWRATIFAESDSPEGPFANINYDAPVTPRDFMTLDGTFYVDHDGTPWLVYAHEWVQKVDGPMEAIALTPDLKTAVGEPKMMFRASLGSAWIEYQNYQYQPQYDTAAYGFSGRKYPLVTNNKSLSHKQETNVVTDGPHIMETPNGGLVCLFTTYRDDEYIQAQLVSPTGNILGPWFPAPFLDHDDKGHGMVFETREGGLMLVMHNNMGGSSHNTRVGAGNPPNLGTSARAEICDVVLTDDGYRVTSHRADLDGQISVTSYDDVLAPLIYAPANRYATTKDGEPGANVDFIAFAMDDREGWNYNNPQDVTLTYSHDPGSFFPIGETVVTVTASDSKGNVATEDFSVFVKQGAAEVSINGPASVVSGSGATADYTISVDNMQKVSGIELEFELDGGYLGAKAFTAIGFDFFAEGNHGFPVFWKNDGDIYTGKVTLIDADGVNGNVDILKMLLYVQEGVLGNSAVKLNYIKLSYGGSEVYSEIVKDTASTVFEKYYSPYDLNKDGVIDLNDITFALQFFGAQEGDADWDEAKVVDFSGNGSIGVEDLLLILNNYTIPYYQ